MIKPGVEGGEERVQQKRETWMTSLNYYLVFFFFNFKFLLILSIEYKWTEGNKMDNTPTRH